MAKRCSRRHAKDEAVEPTDQTAVEEAFYQSKVIELEDIKEVIGKLGGNEHALIQLKGVSGKLAKVAVVLSDRGHERFLKSHGPKKDGFLVMRVGAGVRKHIKQQI